MASPLIMLAVMMMALSMMMSGAVAEDDVDWLVATAVKPSTIEPLGPQGIRMSNGTRLILCGPVFCCNNCSTSFSLWCLVVVLLAA